MTIGRGRIGAAVLAATLCGAAARAQTDPGAPVAPWRIGAFGGWYSGATPYSARGGESGDVRFEGAAAAGLRLGYAFGAAAGLEASWTHTEPDVRFTRSAAGARAFRRLDTYDLDLRLSFGAPRWSVFLLGGPGAASTGSSFGGTNLTVAVGPGFEVFLTRRLALRIDGRWRETYGNLGPGDRFAYCERSVCFAYRHKWYASREATGGVAYAF